MAEITLYPLYSWNTGKESAGQSKIPKMLSGGVKRLSACNLSGDADDVIRVYCKTIWWNPKNDNFDPKIIFFNWGFADRSYIIYYYYLYIYL